MEVEALVKTLAYTLAEVEAEKLGETLVDEKSVAMIDALDDRLADVQTKSLRETLRDVRVVALVK